jgi:hypothetical protein
LVLGLEAAFFGGPPLNGDRFPFGRVRIRIDTPIAGDYTVVYPFGTITFPNASAGIRGINFTQDIGAQTPNFSAALGSSIGPSLVAVNPPPPAGYVGDPQITQTVAGSPTGNNLFRVIGPPGSNLDGLGGNTVETNLFSVAGKIFTGQLPALLTVDRAVYARTPLATQIDVFATSSPNATLHVYLGALAPAPVPMIGDGSGKFFTHFLAPGAVAVPTFVTVTAFTPPPGIPTSHVSNLVDDVAIISPTVDLSTRTLTIEASSSDETGSPTLTAEALGALAGGSLVITDVVIPPAWVTMNSSAGGTDTEPVTLFASGNIPPFAISDGVAAVANAATVINVAANDMDMDGSVVPATVAVVANPANGTVLANGDGTVTYTPALDFLGTDSFTYTVQDDLGALSNEGTVTAQVIPSNIAPTAMNDSATTTRNVSVLVNVAANDTDPDGTINPASVALVTPPVNGVATSNGAGTFTYLPALNFVGADSFTYTVQDNVGASSNVATVSVGVSAPAEVLIVTRAEFRRALLTLRVEGTSSVPGPDNTITIHAGPTLAGPVIGTAPVDTLGAWRFRQVIQNPPAGVTSVSVESTGGASVLNIPLTIR